jgi:MacB-like periplasmic core domain/FtsX-like permease family
LVSEGAWSYAWYRFRASFHSEWSYLLLVVLLIGALGGLSMGSIVAARSTGSSFTDLVNAEHVPQLFVADGTIDPAIGLDNAYNPALVDKLAHLPFVERVGSEVELNGGPLSSTGQPLPETSSSPNAEASVNGLEYTEDPVFITAGQMPNPNAPDEFAIDAASATSLGYHLGEVVPFGWVTNAQSQSGNVSPSTIIPVDQRARLKLVGLIGGQTTTLIHDQNSDTSGAIILLTPALTNRLLDCCANLSLSALTLQDGNAHLSAVEREVKALLPKGFPFVSVESQDVEATAAATLRPEAIALAVFGGIAGLATLLIAGQVITRRLRLRADDLDVARALGANPPMAFLDGLIGTLGAILTGSALAGLVALALSPLAPIGPVRPFIRIGVHADWTVIGLGTALLLLGLSALAMIASARSLPNHLRDRSPRVPSSRVTTAATRAGLPPSAVAGVRFALEPGVGRGAVPVRSAILGAVLAVTVVVTTVTFGSSLTTLVNHPALYGWNWTYDMDGGGGLGDVPGQAAAKLLDADPMIQSWTGVYYSSLELDGQNVPVLGTTPNAQVAPPLLSGHGLEASSQVVLGAATLRQLGKHIGDTVVERAPDNTPQTLTIVGTATLPPIGVAGSSHLEMGTGAVLAYQLIPVSARNVFEVTPGPNAILIRMKGGASPAALRNLQDIGNKLNIAENGGSILPVQRPAEILNYGTLGSTPLLLGIALAAGAAVALCITLITSVRRRRRDLAILKTLGFTRGQLVLAIAVQASVAAVIGCAIGIPVGVALGRVLWDLFAGEISAVPYPTVPALSVVAIGVAAIALAVVAASIPGRLAARTHTSQLLRAE